MSKSVFAIERSWLLEWCFSYLSAGSSLTCALLFAFPSLAFPFPFLPPSSNLSYSLYLSISLLSILCFYEAARLERRGKLTRGTKWICGRASKALSSAFTAAAAAATATSTTSRRIFPRLYVLQSVSLCRCGSPQGRREQL